jgi:broad specificity phosphatase PhoE
MLLAALVLALTAPHAFSDPSVVILVRHAERAAEPADDPPLSEAGQARAKALAAVLSDTRLDAIFTTQFLRTRDTAALVVRKAGVEPRWFKVGDDTAAHVRAVAEAIQARTPGEVVLVVGHSNTVPAIIGALGGPKMFNLCETEYANLFVLVFANEGPRLIRSYFGVPHPPMPADCNRSKRNSNR